MPEIPFPDAALADAFQRQTLAAHAQEQLYAAACSVLAVLPAGGGLDMEALSNALAALAQAVAAYKAHVRTPTQEEQWRTP